MKPEPNDVPTAEQWKEIKHLIQTLPLKQEEANILRQKAGLDTIKLTMEEVKREINLVEQIADARKALELASTDYKAGWLVWLEISKAALPEFRQWRMAMDQECRLSMAAFADVRKFFLSEDHTEQMKRLKEFVEICERLKALKDSGFLDSVADTILKLESKA